MAASPASARSSRLGRTRLSAAVVAGAAAAALLAPAAAPASEAARLTATAGPASEAVPLAPGAAPAREAVRLAPTRAEATIARVVAPVRARARPAARSVVMRVGTHSRWNGGPVGLLVLRSRTGPDGRLWLRVRLQRRPNGSSGWIRADFVQLRRTSYRVEISTRRRVVRVLRRGRTLRRFRAVVGRRGWPTPHGLFAVAERVAQPYPRGFLGPWALHLTAFSSTLFDYGGGPGTIGIHGRGGASLLDPLGTARSHGCVRIDNGPIRLLARVAREGTPVAIGP